MYNDNYYGTLKFTFWLSIAILFLIIFVEKKELEIGKLRSIISKFEKSSSHGQILKKQILRSEFNYLMYFI